MIRIGPEETSGLNLILCELCLCYNYSNLQRKRGDEKVFPLLSRYARKKKIDYFIKSIPRKSTILEIGCGDGWLRDYCRKNGYSRYTGLDIAAPVEITGDILGWRGLGIKENSFDVIIAFEILEHIDCLDACHQILKPRGVLMVTTPVPHFDWFLKVLEFAGLSQKRRTPHNNLIYLKQVGRFKNKNIRQFYFLSQWGLLVK